MAVKLLAESTRKQMSIGKISYPRRRAELLVCFNCKSAGKWQAELPYYRALELHFWKVQRLSKAN